MIQKDIVLSICCITYNHKKYIKKALESFLKQKTKFSYEIIVHDDASTDGTTEILVEFQKKYPIVRPIYQNINQYSKGVNILEKFVLPKVKGKYVAFCEGDDFWCDDTKLQKQVDFLDKHKDYSGCVHNTLVWDQQTNKKNKKVNEINACDQDITVERILEWDRSVPFHTSSVVCKSDILKENLPNFFMLPKCFGDYPLALYMATKGNIYFFDNIMSVYRASVPDSYSIRTRNVDFQVKKEWEKYYMLQEFNRYSEYKYDKLIKETMLKVEFQINTDQKKFKENLSPKYKEIRQKMTIIQKIKLFIKAYCIHVYKLYDVIKN